MKALIIFFIGMSIYSFGQDTIQEPAFIPLETALSEYNGNSRVRCFTEIAPNQFFYVHTKSFTYIIGGDTLTYFDLFEDSSICELKILDGNLNVLHSNPIKSESNAALKTFPFSDFHVDTINKLISIIGCSFSLPQNKTQNFTITEFDYQLNKVNEIPIAEGIDSMLSMNFIMNNRNNYLLAFNKIGSMPYNSSRMYIYEYNRNGELLHHNQITTTHTCCASLPLYQFDDNTYFLRSLGKMYVLDTFLIPSFGYSYFNNLSLTGNNNFRKHNNGVLHSGISRTQTDPNNSDARDLGEVIYKMSSATAIDTFFKKTTHVNLFGQLTQTGSYGQMFIYPDRIYMSNTIVLDLINGLSTISLYSIDDTGQERWSKYFQSNKEIHVTGLCPLRDSGVAIVLSVPINQNIGAYLLRFDKDGNMTNFSTDVTDIERNIKLTAFPNPTSDFITFDLEGFDNKPLEIQFYNIEGKLVFENTFYSFKQFDVSGLQNGIYSYRITSKSSLIKSGLFIKQ